MPVLIMQEIATGCLANINQSINQAVNLKSLYKKMYRTRILQLFIFYLPTPVSYPELFLMGARWLT